MSLIHDQNDHAQVRDEATEHGTEHGTVDGIVDGPDARRAQRERRHGARARDGRGISTTLRRGPLDSRGPQRENHCREHHP